VSDADATAWVAYAEADLAAARVLLAAPDGLWDIVCYHCQQAAEKHLKAVLVAAQRPYPRIHDLAELVRLVAAHEPEAVALAEEAAWLTDAGAQARYPAVEEPCDRADANRALASASRIRSFCREWLAACSK